MKWTNRYVDERYNKSLLKYEFANGSFIEFFSADVASDEESVTSSSTMAVLTRFSVVMAVFNFLVLAF